MSLEKPIDIIPNEEFEPQNLVVNALILNGEGQYLLLKRPSNHTFYPGYWGVVMEKVKEGEGWEEALFRGVREELSICINHRNIISQGEDLFKEWKQEIYKIKTYLIEIEEKEIELNEEHRKYKWLDISSKEIEDMDIMPDALNMIKSLRDT